MTPIRSSSGPPAYANDMAYLAHLIEGVKARAHHLGAALEARRDAEENHGTGLSVVGSDKADDGKLARLAAIDERVWAEIDARRAATREAGTVLGLDALCDEHDLDQVERHTLILTMVPALGLDLYDTLGQIGDFSFALMSITPEMVAQFTGLDLAGRVALFGQVGPDSKLVEAGLIDGDHGEGDRVQEFWTSGLFLTEAAFDRITGWEPPDLDATTSPPRPVVH